MISTSDITIVFQGNVTPFTSSNGESFLHFANVTRSTLPNAKIILSTWEGVEVPHSAPIDQVVRSKDPGSLPGVKFDDKPSNLNRQIVSTLAGLNEVKTKYAIKMRTDCSLEHAGFLEQYNTYQAASSHGEDRLLTTSFFTIDPTIFEHMPFHVSDWFHFSTTEQLLKYWCAPQMTKQDASHYEQHKFAKHSSYLDRKFRARLAVEQYLGATYAKQFGYSIPQFHNDTPRHILEGYEDFLARHLLVLDPWQAGLCFPKYFWAYESKMQWMNCVMFLDWYRLYVDKFSPAKIDRALYDAGMRRVSQKARVRAGAKLIDPFGSIWYSHKFNAVAGRALRWAMR
ncbi:WavE lipopolysaccharide synthesis family protein [Burkholderia metallica]|uniref:WavE lipopolysaccharide synthesis family protein n=1 Tax=Burkholderia metallica TaxID=488729 RepID=UPI001CF13B89|nr:WavE lipopolysaccharide synthesis family protein [Burkholderia metallica]MCA7998059.1 WavE lipopolysaccharide synthesis family protein [Burkholderia metallica]